MLNALESWYRVYLLKKRARCLRHLILKAPFLTQEVLDWQDELDGICDLLMIVDQEWVDTVRMIAPMQGRPVRK